MLVNLKCFLILLRFQKRQAQAGECAGVLRAQCQRFAIEANSLIPLQIPGGGVAQTH